MTKEEYQTAEALKKQFDAVVSELEIWNSDLTSKTKLGCILNTASNFGLRLNCMSDSVFNTCRDLIIADLESQKAALLAQFQAI